MADCNAVPIPANATPETANAAGAMQHQGSAVIAEATVVRIGDSIADLPLRRRAVAQSKRWQSIDFPVYSPAYHQCPASCRSLKPPERFA